MAVGGAGSAGSVGWLSAPGIPALPALSGLSDVRTAGSFGSVCLGPFVSVVWLGFVNGIDSFGLADQFGMCTVFPGVGRCL